MFEGNLANRQVINSTNQYVDEFPIKPDLQPIFKLIHIGSLRQYVICVQYVRIQYGFIGYLYFESKNVLT